MADKGAKESLTPGNATLRTLQKEDVMLQKIRDAADGHTNSAGVGFFWQDGLLWVPPGRPEEDGLEQLVLPKKCRRAVGSCSGKEKTGRRILKRFYWPTLYRDVEFCQSCTSCQKSSNLRTHPVPLVPLPVIGKPFARVTMP